MTTVDSWWTRPNFYEALRQEQPRIRNQREILPTAKETGSATELYHRKSQDRRMPKWDGEA